MADLLTFLLTYSILFDWNGYSFVYSITYFSLTYSLTSCIFLLSDWLTYLLRFCLLSSQLIGRDDWWYRAYQTSTPSNSQQVCRFLIVSHNHDHLTSHICDNLDRLPVLNSVSRSRCYSIFPSDYGQEKFKCRFVLPKLLALFHARSLSVLLFSMWSTHTWCEYVNLTLHYDETFVFYFRHNKHYRPTVITRSLTSSSSSSSRLA